MHEGGEGIAHDQYYAIPVAAALRNLELEYNMTPNTLQLEVYLTWLAMIGYI